MDFQPQQLLLQRAAACQQVCCRLAPLLRLYLSCLAHPSVLSWQQQPFYAPSLQASWLACAHLRHHQGIVGLQVCLAGPQVLQHV